MERGYVKLWRKVEDSGILQNANAWQLFSYLLLNSNYKKTKITINGAVIDILPGQVIFGRKKCSDDIKQSEQSIRTSLKILEKLEILTIQPTNKYSLITFVNWDTYQNSNQQFNQQSNQHLTSAQPAPNQHLTTSKEGKNERKEEVNTYSASDDAAGNLESNSLKGKKKAISGKRLEWFNRFWDAFGDKRGRAEAIDAWASIPQLTDALCQQIVDAAKNYADNVRPQLLARDSTPKMAQGWITSRRWEDESVGVKIMADDPPGW